MRARTFETFADNQDDNETMELTAVGLIFTVGTIQRGVTDHGVGHAAAIIAVNAWHGASCKRKKFAHQDMLVESRF